MLYRDVPCHKIYMRCEHKADVGGTIPHGYHIETYTQGREEDWCSIQVESGHVETRKQAQQIFTREFAPHPERLQTHMWFMVADEAKEAVGTIALWEKVIQGEVLERIHWLGVKDEHSGRGIARALLKAACDASTTTMFLDSQTWSYPAILLYEQAGFVRWNAEGQSDYDLAWAHIDEKRR